MISTYVPILPVGNVTELNRHLDVRRWDQTTKGNWQLGAREVAGKPIKNGVQPSDTRMGISPVKCGHHFTCIFIRWEIRISHCDNEVEIVTVFAWKQAL